MPDREVRIGTRLRALEPVLNDGVYAFVSVARDAEFSHIPSIGTFHEKEGVTLIVPEADAERQELQVRFRAAWITLTTETDLGDVGITAAVSHALHAAGIACNVVAAVYHDHIFVPADRANDALAAIRAI